MRNLVVTIASSVLFAAAAQAADTSPVAGQFPDTASNRHVYLFTLKKNGISLKIDPGKFCHDMDYGEAVFSQKEDDTEKAVDHKVKTIEGDLDWVICRFNGK
jgi:hypothetical protein